ncbi:MAG TPA: hypothetical protein VIJ92_02425 [Ginsengibacter sp.]
MHNNNLLLQKIELLPLTAGLKNILVENNISNLGQLLQVEVHKWHEDFTGFTYHHQHEIVSFLDENNMTGLLKEQ